MRVCDGEEHNRIPVVANQLSTVKRGLHDARKVLSSNSAARFRTRGIHRNSRKRNAMVGPVVARSGSYGEEGKRAKLVVFKTSLLRLLLAAAAQSVRTLLSPAAFRAVLPLSLALSHRTVRCALSLSDERTSERERETERERQRQTDRQRQTETDRDGDRQ